MLYYTDSIMQDAALALVEKTISVIAPYRRQDNKVQIDVHACTHTIVSSSSFPSSLCFSLFISTWLALWLISSMQFAIVSPPKFAVVVEAPSHVTVIWLSGGLDEWLEFRQGMTMTMFLLLLLLLLLFINAEKSRCS